ncbi:MATE family efflux transporter [Clostridium sp. LBM24168]
MEIDNKSFAKEKTTRLIFKFAIPSILALLVSELYNVVDTVYVGHYIGIDALAAITIAYPIQKLLIASGLLIAVGSSTYCARSLGKRENEEFRKITLASLGITGIVLLFISFIIFIFRNPIFFALGANKLTYILVDKYVSIILLGGIFQALSVVACYIMTTLKKTRTLLYTNLVGVTLNIAINYILIVIFNFGIEGAAIATVISQISAFTFAFFKFKEVIVQFNILVSIKSIFKSIKMNIVINIITVGFSTFVIEFEDALVSIVLNNILYEQGGNSAIVMMGIITKVSMFLYVIIIGISYGIQPIIAYNCGAQDHSKIKSVLTISIKTILLAAFSCLLVFLVFGNYIIGFFLNDINLLHHTVKAFRLSIFLVPLTGIYYIVINYYQAIGEAKKSFLFSIYKEIIIFIPLSLLFIQLFGLKGLWYAYPIADGSAALTAAYFLNKALNENEPQNLKSTLAIK